MDERLEGDDEAAEPGGKQYSTEPRPWVADACCGHGPTEKPEQQHIDEQRQSDRVGGREHPDHAQQQHDNRDETDHQHAERL